MASIPGPVKYKKFINKVMKMSHKELELRNLSGIYANWKKRAVELVLAANGAIPVFMEEAPRIDKKTVDDDLSEFIASDVVVKKPRVKAKSPAKRHVGPPKDIK